MRDTLSDFLPVTSGVPQGSVLGPLLFAIYINDMPDLLVHSDCYLFADDSKLLYHGIDLHSLDSIMQVDIDVFDNWSHINKMQFNLSKCKVIDFSFKADSNINVIIKDLGLYVNQKLN